MRVLYVATVVKTHIMQFHIPYLKCLKEMGWEVSVAARNDYDNPGDCKIPYCDYYYDIPFERSPYKIGNIKAYSMLKRIIDEGDYDIIHCHTPMGGVLARLAGRKSRRRGTKIIYTAHGFHFYKGAPLINWLLFYPIERLMAHYTDTIITINHEDYETAKTFCCNDVKYIEGVGVDIDRFYKIAQHDNKELRNKFSIPEDSQVLLSVGEVNSNKNHRVVIEALKSIPSAWFVLCGDGPHLETNKKLAEELGVSDRVVFAGYRNELEEFYRMSNIFVFPSRREGLPVALMEAMAAGLICVASVNRGTRDLLPDSRLLFNSDSIGELLDKLNYAINTDCSDEIDRNLENIKRYDIKRLLPIMKDVYIGLIKEATN